MPTFEFDVINYWSEVKLDIIKDYAEAYSTIMAKQQWCKGHFYIDALHIRPSRHRLGHSRRRIGTGARPVDPEWVREIRDLCQDQNVPFFFKQWGGVFKKRTGRVLDGRVWEEFPVSSLKV
ncbi:MAG TPA: DUF5131 family protein [Chthoniobacterales bacterium]|nr:DUF5131 family protein [Chthoniobacterales bacterium]